MSGKPIGWTGNDHGGYRFPVPRREYDPPFEEVVDCGGILIRRQRPGEEAHDSEVVREEEERARTFLDPLGRGEMARRAIFEKYGAMKRRT
jgi:hypothetical protein